MRNPWPDRLAGEHRREDSEAEARREHHRYSPHRRHLDGRSRRSRHRDAPRRLRSDWCAARAAGKPGIVATRMLESTTTSPTPTRAEASAVAAAVYGGADAVMLSAESVSGEYPVEAVAFMQRIVAKAHVPNATDTIGAVVETGSNTLPPGATVTYAMASAPAVQLSRLRSRTAILSLKPRVETAQQPTPVWGASARRRPASRTLSRLRSRQCG